MHIDIHTHAVPAELIEMVRANPSRYQVSIEKTSNEDEFIRHDQGFSYPLFRSFYDTEYRLQEMDRRRIDVDVMSISPQFYHYWTDSEIALEVARAYNDGIYRMTCEYPDRLQAMASLPMQDVSLAIKELERVVDDYNFKYAEIGTSVEGKHYDDPCWLPFFKKAEELNVALMFHPYYITLNPVLSDYYLTNLIGNPLDTTICIARLVFGGVLKECPGSRFIFVHAGGYMPYQRGRLEHGYQVRNEPKIVLKDNEPGAYFDQVYYDTITHWGPALESLIKTHGAEKVLLGSDYPFDMADPDPVKSVESLNLPSEVKNLVLGQNVINFK